MNIRNAIAEMGKREKSIYAIIYASLFLGLFSVMFAGFAGYKISNNIILTVYGRKNSSVSDSVYNNVVQLKNQDTKLQRLVTKTNNIRYPSRNIIRGDINNDVAALGFDVQAFSIKDAKDTDNKNKIDLKGMLLVTINGTIPSSNLMKLFELIDRKDRFWYLSKIVIKAPDGSDTFFSSSFQNLRNAQKKEYIESYNSNTPDILPVEISFITFVNEEKPEENAQPSSDETGGVQ